MIKNTIIPISELNTALSMILIGLLFANFRKLPAEGTSYSVGYMIASISLVRAD